MDPRAWSTFSEFLEIVKSYSVTLETTKGPLIGPRGPVLGRYFKRVGADNKVTHIAEAPDIGNDEQLTPTMIWTLCRRLDIPPSDFGFTLETFVDWPE